MKIQCQTSIEKLSSNSCASLEIINKKQIKYIHLIRVYLYSYGCTIEQINNDLETFSALRHT